MVFRNSIILALFSISSQLLGIFRDRLLAHYVGIGRELDVYNAAFRVPDLMLGIMISFAGALTVVPFISKAIHDNNKQDLEERFSSLFIFFGISMFFIGVMVIIFVPYFAKFIVLGFTHEQITEFIFYTRILMVQPILLGLSSLISTLAQARHQFLLYGGAPLVYTLGIILSIIFGYNTYGLIAIIIGVVIGAIGNLLLQSLTLYHNSVRISFSRFKWSLIKEQFSVSVPRSMSQVVAQLRTVFFTSFATTLGGGALSIYVFAQRIADAVVQIISQSPATATLPLLSAQYSSGDLLAYRKTFKKNVYTIFFISFIVAVFCATLSNLIVYILYGDVKEASSIAHMLTILSFSFPFYALNTYFVTAFHAMKDSKTSLITNILVTIVAIVACFGFREFGFGLSSIGYATLVVSVFYTAISFFFYVRKKHLFNK